MNETTSGSSYKSSRIVPASGSAVIIPPQAIVGPETVINPEARPVITDAPPADSGPVSELATVLFPVVQTGSGSHFPGPQGVLLGHFRIESCIRSGGMGAVFKAIDVRLNRHVALKVLPPGHSRDPSIVQRFRHEAQAVARLDHENIAQVHFIGEDQGLHFIAFEFVSGVNLRDLIQQQGTLQQADAVNYTLQVAHALVHTNQNGVVHRDIKPSNIIITPEGRAKLVDLGLARIEDRDPADQLTVAGTTLGTFDYISPEQAKDPRSVDVRSDIYSLGCTLYHMLTGEPPYAEGTMLQKLLDHQAKDVPDPRQKNRFLSADLSAIVQKMMAPDPQSRYQIPEQLIRDLMYVAESMGLQNIANSGQVWMVSGLPQASFLQKHGGWLITAAVLMLFVAYLKYSDDRAVRLPIIPTQNSSLPAPGNNASTEKPILDGQPDPSGSGTPTAETNEAGQAKGGTSNPVPVPLTPSAPTETSETPPKVAGTGSSESLTPITTNPDAPPESTEEGIKLFQGLPTPLTNAPGDLGKSPKPVAVMDPKSPTGEPGKSTATENGTLKTLLELDKTAPFLLTASATTAEKRYPTLEAACAEAVDGSIIELRFNGIQRQRPVRITKKITIRAARGYTPQLEIAPQAGTVDDGRLITISGGTLHLVEVNLIARVSELPVSDVWALFSVLRGEQLRLENSAVTLLGHGAKSPVLVEFRPTPPESIMETDTSTLAANRTPFRVDLQNSMIRGQGDFFLIRNALGQRLSVQNCIIAVEGLLVRNEGTPEVSRQSGPTEIQLEQNTLVVNGGLIAFDAGELPRTLSRIDMHATNNIITAVKRPDAPLKPLISMKGNVPQDDFNKLLTWSGLRNFYHPFETFWVTQSTDVTGKSISLKFPEWKLRWGTEHEIEADNGLIIWLQNWSEKPPASLIPGDFVLDPSVANINPAVAGANDGGDAGINLDELSRLRVDPLPEANVDPGAK